MPQPDKQSLRRALRQRRRQLTPGERQVAEQRVAGLIDRVPGWQQATHLGLYLAADGELSADAIAARARALGKHLYLPVVREEALHFYPWRPDTHLQPNRYGIPEPHDDQPEYPLEKLDILLMPLVGWDRSGNRLGMGGGFYDRSLAPLAHRGPVRVGLAYEFQEVANLPRDGWDAGMDYVLTERELHAVRSENPDDRTIRL